MGAAPAFAALLLVTAPAVAAAPLTFNYAGAIVNWTVPVGVTQVRIEARGAEGGFNANSGIQPGLGADMRGDFTVTPGSQLQILVGQQPSANSGNGGGGGTFVTDSSNNPLIVAGGGGGSSQTTDSSNKDGQAGTAGGTGAAGGGTGGTGGSGGDIGASGFQAGAGGGLLTNGADGWTSGTGGQAFVNGGAGGSTNAPANGGFGGGGSGSSYVVGGGGGGYSGGGSGGNSSGGVGGGGGSYNGGNNEVNVGGSNSGNGLVTIITFEAPSLIVNDTSDVVDPTDGVTTLREAINYANTDGVDSAITFDPTVFAAPQKTITLGGTELVLANNGTVSITAPAAGVTVSGAGNSRVFNLANSATASLTGLTIVNGAAPDKGGGIDMNTAATLTVSNCTISGNSANLGGGIYNSNGTLTITGSAIISNTVSNAGGGLYTSTLGGTPSPSSYSLLQNCTFSANSASSSGGAIHIDNGLTTLDSCTITANRSQQSWGCGIAAYGDPAIDARLINSIVAGNLLLNNSPGTDVDFIVTGTNSFESQGHNLIGAGNATGNFNQTGDSFNVSNPGLSPLGNYGGPTQTHALIPGSPAIDNGATTLGADQRGVTRAQGSGDDIGAFEARQPFIIGGLVRSNTLAAIDSAGLALTTSPGGAAIGTATTNSSGAYSFTNVVEGYYAIAATKSGYTFIPATQGLRVSTANRAANFVGIPIGIPNGVSVSGRVMTSSGISIVGATVTADTGQTATTNSAGYYTFTGIADGSRTITPSLAGTIFTPTSKPVTVSGANMSGINFIGATGYTVTGRIATSAGLAIPSVSVQLDAGATVTTNSAGYFTLSGVPNGGHTLTPSLSGKAFTPASRSITVNNANLNGQNFIGQ